MKKLQIDWKRLTARRLAGLCLVAAGVFVLLSPILVGEWVISILGLIFIGAGAVYFVDTIRAAEKAATIVSYAAGIVSVLLGIVLFLSPRTALSGLILAVAVFLVADGVFKVYGAFKASGRERRWGFFNGAVTLLLAAIVASAMSAELGVVAISVILGLWLAVQGWTLFFLPERGLDPDAEERDLNEHPDRKLGLESGADLREINTQIAADDRSITRQDIFWSLTVLTILFFVHLIRVPLRWSLLGFISPFVAVLGDAMVALLVGVALVLPARMAWRKFTRPVERIAWARMRMFNDGGRRMTIAETLLRYWIESRMRFSHELRTVRLSLNYAFWRLLRFGLPLTAILVSISSIWGFSWYFNSENWASAVFQKITQNRVDTWRMRAAEAVEARAVANGIKPEEVFSITPQGLERDSDFSFVVIGDTGEGDPSQVVLRDQIIAAGERESVKFLILSSDVIYPDGKMDDYEDKFYLPFKGFRKPLYAIPGNHDWFDANEGFSANFLTPEAARVTIAEGLERDLGIGSAGGYDEIIAEAARLRNYYGIQNGLQRAPFFDLHTDSFSLIAVDTGILRSLDAKQLVWLERSLKRAADNFKLVILGHPFYVAGKPTYGGDEDFQKIRDLLAKFEVDVVMAGDTHDFEYYIENLGPAPGTEFMNHFVNGGGGAYLSVGTALGFPEDPFTDTFAFYPRADELTEKIRSEAPYWKMPFLFWMQTLGGWPFDQEIVSGAFDFNSAPFFQSFVIVNVESSKEQIRIELIGANGPISWRQIQAKGLGPESGRSGDEAVEFVIPMTGKATTIRP